MLDAPRLNDAQFLAGEIGDICRAVAEESVDEGQVEVIADGVADALRAGTEEMQDTVNETLVHDLVDGFIGKPRDGFDENRFVDFVNIIFVLEEAELQFVFGRGIDIAIHQVAERESAEGDDERRQQRNGMKFARFGMVGEGGTGKFMEPVREESAEDGEILRDAEPAIPDG